MNNAEIEAFQLEMLMFKSKALIEGEEKCDNLIKMYVKDLNNWILRNPTKTIEEYANLCCSMVTVFLFQAPLYPCKNSEERRLFFEEFNDWHPLYFIKYFDKNIKIELSKLVNKI